MSKTTMLAVAIALAACGTYAGRDDDAPPRGEVSRIEPAETTPVPAPGDPPPPPPLRTVPIPEPRTSATS